VIEQRMETDAKTGAMKGVSLDRYDLIPPKAIEYIALVYGTGSLKYADRNWEKGYKWGLSFRALLKHAFAAWRGEWLDSESGLPHLAHAAWHCLTLMTYHDYRLGTDDRSPMREKAPAREAVRIGNSVAYLPTPEEVARIVREGA
jgi:hypothetical protein